MCDTGNLIDLTGWDEPIKDETVTKETHSETVIVESEHFNGPYDPFDSVEKEACIKGLNYKNETQKLEEQDLNNETPPVAMEIGQRNADEPEVARSSESNQVTLQKHIAKLNAIRAANISNTPPHPQSTKFSRYAILTESLQMIAAESPVKFIEDEPNVTPAPPAVSDLSDDACSNTEFEERLKMMRLAVLEPLVKIEQRENIKIKVDSPSQGEVGKLLQDLKALISEHVDISKRGQFNTLIESLSAAVQGGEITAVKDTSPQSTTDSPHKYTRQATFDLDLELRNKKSEGVQEFPDVMTCSSATFDGESVAVHDKLTLPVIETELPKVPADLTAQTPDSYVTEFVNKNLALQISELLERHNLTKQSDDAENNVMKAVGAPTVIFVVNSTAGNGNGNENQPPSCIVHPSTTNTRANTLRRRSSSLSIHDKSKQDRPRTFVKQSSGDGNTQSVPLKELSSVGDKLNVMASFKQRRNSFTVGSTTAAAAAAAQGRALLSSRNKAAVINESIIKPSTSTKQTLPVKRVVPMVKPKILSAEVNHFNSTLPRCIGGQDTPMPTKPGGKMFCTSTPMTQMRTQPRKSLKPVFSFSSNSSSVSRMSYSKKTTQ